MSKGGVDRKWAGVDEEGRVMSSMDVHTVHTKI